jgi:hypothetical protein
MSREAAAEVLGVIIEHGKQQDAVLEKIRSTCSDDEFNWLRQMIGRSMGAMLLDVINPIVAKYPELKPPGLD